MSAETSHPNEPREKLESPELPNHPREISDYKRLSVTVCAEEVGEILFDKAVEEENLKQFT